MSTENLIWTALGASAAWVVIVAKILSATMMNALKVQLSEFREQMRSEFADKFQDSKLLEARLLPMIQEIQQNRARIIEVDDYAHKWRHAHAGALQRLFFKTKLDDDDVEI